MKAKKKSKKKNLRVKLHEALPKKKKLTLKEQLEEVNERIKELEKTDSESKSIVSAAKDYYLQESIFSKKYSNEILLETSKLFNIPTMDILY